MAARFRRACRAPSCRPRPMPGARRSSAGGRCRSPTSPPPPPSTPSAAFPSPGSRRTRWAATSRSTSAGRARSRSISARGARTGWARCSCRRSWPTRSRAWPPPSGARAARDEFYRGETAKRIAEFHRANDGPLTAADLADFSVEVGAALRTTFGAYEVAACGFWCQGPALLQMLNLLDGVDLVALGHNSPAYLHRLVETVKL